MKVHKSSKACKEHNDSHREYIDAGLEEALEPNDNILRNEKREEELAALRLKKLEILKSIDANSDGRNVHGIPVEFVETYSVESTWPVGRHSGWKLIIGESYRKISEGFTAKITVGDGIALILSFAQKQKINNAIAKISEAYRLQAEKQDGEQQTKMRYAMVFGNAEFKQLIGRITGYSYVSEYGTTSFQVEADGRWMYKGERFSIEQWIKIIDLRDKQHEEMKALKATFFK